MAMLDIIVTHYRLPFSAGKQIFDTIAVQRGINFSDIRVLVVNDGPLPIVVRGRHLPSGWLARK